MQIAETVFPLSNFASAQKNLVRVYQGARVGARSEEFSQLNPSFLCYLFLHPRAHLLHLRETPGSTPEPLEMGISLLGKRRNKGQ